MGSEKFCLLRADVLKMTIWQTPAGIVDEGGYVLPSWLNFGITLMGPPANGVMHVRPPSLTSSSPHHLSRCSAGVMLHASSGLMTSYLQSSFIILTLLKG